MTGGRDALFAALESTLRDLPAGSALGIAVSGGPDSVALAGLAAHWVQQKRHALHLLHVHHGLYEQADGWAEQVRALARALNVACHVRHVQVPVGQGDGVEAAARAVRYRALAAMAGENDIGYVLLGHHLDDQAETVMLRLLRGAGPDGMGAMAASVQRDGVTYLRPWLDIERVHIVEQATALAADMGISLVDDPSNRDARYARGVLRTRVFPAIAGLWPGYRQTLSRFARLSGDAAAVLAEVAEADLAGMRRLHPAYGDTLDLSMWRALSPARRSLALRAWLENQGMAMPPEARLAQMCHQLLHAAPDRQVLLQHGGIRVRSYRNLVMIDRAAGGGKSRAAPEPAVQADASCDIQWQGQTRVPLPGLGGTLYFEPDPDGVDPQWLQAQPLRVTLRRGRERLRPGAQGTSRSLKNLYQEAGIPAWERSRLPLVWRGGSLLFAAGLGLDGRAPRSPDGVALRWESDYPGATVSRPHDKLPPNAG